MKQKIIVAIGGGENGRMLEDRTFEPYNTKEIDKEIVKLANKTNPNFLFINHAMESLDIQESYFQTMKKKKMCSFRNEKNKSRILIKNVFTFL